MFHDNRTWYVAKFTEVNEIAERLTTIDYTLCSGFQIGDILLLNDSISEDSAQEYAVIRALPDGTYQQIESVTVSWCSYAHLCYHIEGWLMGKAYRPFQVHPQITYNQPHTCDYCA